MASKSGAESLGSGYFWVGSKTLSDSLQCNPYLLVDGDEAVLFDPGSVLDVEDVAENIASVIPLDKVKYVVLHHQDPDLASAVPRLEALGMHFTIVTHWRTWSLVRFYGVSSPAYIVDEHEYSLKLNSGKILRFIPTPYLHFPGAIATYDKEAKFLLSSDLFGAFAPTWSLYAGDTYLEGMKTFHEHYMPSHEILGPVMQLFSGINISAILPQHGSIINKDIGKYIDALMHLECGTLIRPAKKPLSETGEFGPPSEQLLVRFAAVFGDSPTKILVDKLGISCDPLSRHIVASPMPGQTLWNRLAEEIYLLNGLSALTVLEPLVQSLCIQYSITRPAIYDSLLRESQKNSENLDLEISKLQQLNDQLSQSASSTQDVLLKDAVTGLYNETYYRNFIDEEASLKLDSEEVEDNVLAIIGIDEGMARIEYQYGPREVEAILKGISRIIVEAKAPNYPAFRLHGATFAVWMPQILFHKANELCDSIRKSVETSKSFIEPVTISIGLVAVADICGSSIETAEAGAMLSDIGLRRLRLARKRGGNTICSFSEVGKEVESKARILIVDDDPVNADVVKTFLENADYTVFTAIDGDEALKKIGEEGYDLIISELMIPKVDGFMLKESLSQRSGTKDIPFILLSHLKDEKSVIRAYKLGVDYYLKKPFLLAELLGIVQKMTAAGAGR
ncbi:MAG TPA: response regulator [Rectinemataceae bacterium]|nr:response regulator [Rectinemataceae bacterium]